MNLFALGVSIRRIIENKQKRTLQYIIENKQRRPIPDIEFGDTALIICSVLVVVLGIVVCIRIIFGPMPTQDTHPNRYIYIYY